MKSPKIAWLTDPNDPNSEIRYGLFDSHGNSEYVDGNPSVIQFVAKLVQTDIGSDLFSPSSGSSIREITAKPFSKDDLRTRISEIGRAFTLIEEQVKASQVGTDLPESERLSRLDILDINYDETLDQWNIEVQFTMEDGNVERRLLS
jgi:phage baseplate assembly protein W